MAGALTAKQKIFVQEYLKDLSPTRAAKCAGYSEKTATSQGSRLLTNVNVSKAIEKAQQKLLERNERTVASIVEDIRAVGLEARAVGKHNDALKALELEGKHYGAFKERVEMTGAEGAPLAITVRFVGVDDAN